MLTFEFKIGMWYDNFLERGFVVKRGGLADSVHIRHDRTYRKKLKKTLN